MQRKNIRNRKHFYLALLAMGAATPAFADVGTINVLATFNGTNGAHPSAGVILSGDGNTLYGVTGSGTTAANSEGTVFSVPVGGGNVTTLAAFGTSSASLAVNSSPGLVLSGGILYGTAAGSGSNYGTVFSVPVSGNASTTLATFPFSGAHGYNPYAGVTLSADAKTLYGTTSNGGVNGITDGIGLVYSLPVGGGNITNLASFPANALPSNLTLIGSYLYGTTANGGNGNGSVFSVPVGGGAVTTLASFNGGINGASPNGGLILSGNTLYGTTYSGGYHNNGTVFSVPLIGGNITTLATFNVTNGLNPNGGLILSGSTLYGEARSGGDMLSGTIFSLPLAGLGGGNATLVAGFAFTDGQYPNPDMILSGNTLYGTTLQGGGNGYGNVWSCDVSPAATTTATTYTLAATVTGSRVLNGRITQGQTANLASIINNTGGNGTDNLAYDTLTLGGPAGMSMISGSGNITPGDNGTASGTFTAHTLGMNAFTPGVGNATNATLGGNAACGGSTNATVWVDPLLEHVNAATLSDTGNASTTPTAFYRQLSAYGGNSLGNVTVVKQAPGIYVPAYMNNINSGTGTTTGTLTINVNGNNNMFGSDTSIVMLGFGNVNHSGVPATEKGYLTTIEGALTTAGVEWRDAFGDSNNWSVTGTGFDPLTGTDFFQNVADYDIELAFNNGSLTSSQSYFDFNFTDQLGSAGNVVNLVVVPEPTSLGWLALGGVGLLAKRRKRRA